MVHSVKTRPAPAPEVERPRTEVEQHVDDAVLAQVMLERARAVVEAYQEARDASIRAAARLGADRTAMARDIGIARRTVYIAIDAPRDDDDARMEWFEAKAIEAEDRWVAAGEEGHPDDYWAL